MSESKEHFYRDFSKFDEMSTEELNEILRQDSQLPDGEDSDTDAILYIMGVIAKRNQELPSSDFGDVNHAWSSFNKNYRFASSEGCSLFDFDDEPQLNGTSDKTQILRPAPRSNTRPRKWVLRTARILAAVIAVLLATSLTAYAFGFELWGQLPTGPKRHLVSSRQNIRKPSRVLPRKKFRRRWPLLPMRWKCTAYLRRFCQVIFLMGLWNVISNTTP